MQRRFSEEFKRAAVARVQSGESQLSVARHLGISSKTLNRWCVTARRTMPAEELFAMDEIARLRKLWNWDVGAEFRISIKKPELQGLRP